MVCSFFKGNVKKHVIELIGYPINSTLFFTIITPKSVTYIQSSTTIRSDRNLKMVGEGLRYEHGFLSGAP